MNGFDIVMVIAIILFARLGVRLVTNYTFAQDSALKGWNVGGALR